MRTNHRAALSAPLAAALLALAATPALAADETDTSLNNGITDCIPAEFLAATSSVEPVFEKIGLTRTDGLLGDFAVFDTNADGKDDLTLASAYDRADTLYGVYVAADTDYDGVYDTTYRLTEDSEGCGTINLAALLDGERVIPGYPNEPVLIAVDPDPGTILPPPTTTSPSTSSGSTSTSESSTPVTTVPTVPVPTGTDEPTTTVPTTTTAPSTTTSPEETPAPSCIDAQAFINKKLLDIDVDVPGPDGITFVNTFFDTNGDGFNDLNRQDLFKKGGEYLDMGAIYFADTNYDGTYDKKYVADTGRCEDTTGTASEALLNRGSTTAPSTTTPGGGSGGSGGNNVPRANTGWEETASTTPLGASAAFGLIFAIAAGSTARARRAS